ncbi:MAG: ribonuclease III [Actinobacteria bacterium RBG_16_70_17]|nr:MAG: ribonuclease III [Actinobacteria bacterium RBG_16_70_17]
MTGPPTRLEQALGHTFGDRNLLERALTHRSHDPAVSNERLEFLGDSVLEFVITGYLYASSGLDEGMMTKVRVSVVSRAALVEVAGRIGVGEAVALGSGEEEAGGREKASILADTLEALLGAVYLDGGIEAVRRVVLAHWAPLVADQIAAPGERDYKTRLQEVLAQQGQTPSYVSEGEGPEHARVFFATVAVGGRVLGTGTGTSKKRAEQAAARYALDTLRAEGEPDA